MATSPTASAKSRTIPLPPEQTFPEGIAVSDGYMFTGSAASGMVTRTRLSDGASTTLVPAGQILPRESDVFPRMLGMKVDRHKRLWIAGGRTGKIFVVDTVTGKLIKELTVPGSGSALNDLVLVGGAAYVTDTTRPNLWRIPFTNAGVGGLERWIDFTGTPLQYDDGLNANGIATVADGSALLVVQMDKGRLFRIQLGTKAIEPVAIDGDISGGDGLVLDRNRLYLVRQPNAEIVTIDLAPGEKSGRVVHRFGGPELQWPATAAKVGGELLVVNTQFDKRGSGAARAPLSIVAIPLDHLNGPDKTRRD